VRGFQQSRQVLIHRVHRGLNLGEGCGVRAGFVFVIQRQQQIEIATRLRRNILDRGQIRGVLLARKRARQRGYIQSHLREHGQVLEGNSDPLRTAPGVGDREEKDQRY